jgi:type VI secretion system protein ImpC
MAEAKPTPAPDAVEAADGEATDGLLDSIFAQVDVHTPAETVGIDEFDDEVTNAEKDKGALVAAALRVFIDAVGEREAPVDRVDKYLLDDLVAQIDEKISQQLDAVLHHDRLQELESSWRGLKFVVDRTDFRQNVRIEMLNASKDDLRESFEDVPELIQSALYKRVYTGAYDQPGADPYSAMVSNYEFENTPQDMALLQSVSKVASSSHCPFLGSVGPAFFGKESVEDWKKIPDLAAHLSTIDYAKWNAFRETEDSRYVGLTFPRFMARLPYGPETVPVKSFGYEEAVTGEDHSKYLWSSAAFPMAANMVEAYIRDGWTVQIRGPQSGGKVEDLPVHLYDVGRGKQMKIPTEVPISETLEFEAANLGFIPLSIYEGRDFACFFSANSAQKPTEYDDPQATANSRINARLPYIFLASRIAHYLKVLQRENIGATKDAGTIETELNRWMSTLITKMPNPTEDLIAKYPLRDGQISVEDVASNPGFYRVSMMVMPHFQIEGMDINLSLVGKMPKAE